MSYFTIPADFKILSLEKIVEFNKNASFRVDEVYGSIKTLNYGCGRRFSELPDASNGEFEEYLTECRKNNIDFNYTLNLSCNSNHEYSEQGQLSFLNQIEYLFKLGVRSFTLTIPSLIDLAAYHFPEIKITLSVIAAVDSVKKAEYFLSHEAIKGIYVYEALNRKIALLKPIIQLCRIKNKEIGTLVNTLCLSNCPFRINHYNQSAHSENGNAHLSEFYGINCAFVRLKDPANVLRSPWIRPEDISFYSELGINKFKVSGRELFRSDADMLKVVSVYNAKSFSGNLVELFQCFSNSTFARIFYLENSPIIDEYIKMVLEGKTLCTIGDCTNCQVCEKAKKAISVNAKEAELWEQILRMELDKFRKNSGFKRNSLLNQRSCNLSSF